MAKEGRIIRKPNRPPSHPGAFVREISLPALDLTKSEFAAALGILRQMLHGILTEKHPMTVDMAVRLGYVLGNGPGIWIRMQQAYDLWHAESRVDTSKLKVVHPKKAA